VVCRCCGSFCKPCRFQIFMLVISSEPYHFSDSRVAGRVESEHN